MNLSKNGKKGRERLELGAETLEKIDRMIAPTEAKRAMIRGKMIAQTAFGSAVETVTRTKAKELGRKSKENSIVKNIRIESTRNGSSNRMRLWTILKKELPLKCEGKTPIGKTSKVSFPLE